MERQNVVYPYSGILFINRKNKLLVHASTYVNLKNILLIERMPPQEITYSMTDLYEISRKGKSTETEKID